jgi:CDP-diacylglycerol--serine O-phosphatidyltransferase
LEYNEGLKKESSEMETQPEGLSKPQEGMQSHGRLRNGKFRKGIYLLPSMFTVLNVCCGFYSVIATLGGRFEGAAIAILVAMILDGLDGLVARLTNSGSDFGIQFDSLADMVSFGVAPAALVYKWGLADLHRIGWITAFLFVICGALRLARFNIQAKSYDKKYFVGLPIPAAAAALSSLAYFSPEEPVEPAGGILIVPIVLILSFLMVSKLRYLSVKTIDIRKRRPYTAILLGVVVLYLLTINPPAVILIITLGYALSGVVMKIIGWIYKKERAPLPETEGKQKNA